MFIGSSVEGKRIAEIIQESLEYDVDSTVWHQGVFGLSGGTLETLVNTLDEYDFATLVLTADDLLEKRNISGRSPRDNVLFELGLFMGALGRSRTFIVHSRTTPPMLPTDLAGITPATYEERGNLGAALGPACTKLKRAIEAQGGRRSPVASVPTSSELARFNEILSEQHTMVTELFRRLTDSAHDAARSPATATTDFLEGAWRSTSGSHGYCRLEQGIPRMIYCWEDNYEATGEYYDFKRIGEEIFGRFRWYEGDIQGFTWLKIDHSEQLTGAWWMEQDVPATAHDNPDLLKQSRRMKPSVWTKQPAAVFPAWATAAFERPIVPIVPRMRRSR